MGMSSLTVHPPPQRAMAGVLALGLILALSRWGTYLSIPPLYITDVLLVLAVLHMLTTQGMLGSQHRASATISLWVPLAVVWAVVRLALSPDWGLLALRDFVPYLYAGVGMISGWAYVTSTANSRAKTSTFLKFALYVHLAWVTSALCFGLAGPALSENTYVFQIRADIDAALVSILGGHALHAVLLKKPHGVSNMVTTAICVGVVSMLPNRAGLLSLAAVFGVTMLAYLASTTTSRQKAAVLAVSPFFVLGGLLALPYTAPGARLLAGLGVGVDPGVGVSAHGTVEARLVAWKVLLDYWNDSMPRFLFGVGFGPDFLADSKTNLLLGSGTYEGVRSPHNYLIGTALRTGMVGLLITTVLLSLFVLALFRVRKQMNRDPVVLLSALIVAAVLPASMVGVLFESPFGAVPTFWAGGVLVAAARVNHSALQPGESREVDRATESCRMA